MRIIQTRFSKGSLFLSLTLLATISVLVSCKKSHDDVAARPVISYQQKIISIPVDETMIAVRPDSTGGPITEYSISPLLPKGITIGAKNGVISGKASDTLSPTRFVVTATGPGGKANDTLTLAIGTVGFTYGNSGVFTFEKNSTELATTPISPVIVAGTFTQFFVAPSPDSLRIKTGLTFNAQTGQISGTPSQLTSTTEVPTPITFTITGISTASKAASTTVSFIINDKKPAFFYTFGGSFAVGTSVGSTLVTTKTAASGNIIKYRLAPTSPALPAGLTLDSLTGQIKGIPTVAADVTVIVRAFNTGGYYDASQRLVINATAVAPQIRYLMSLFSGNVTDTITNGIESGNTIYVTKFDSSHAGVPIYLNPVLTNGQAGTYTLTPAFVSGAANENLSFSSGTISGTPGRFSTNSNPTHAIAISNAATGGPAGSFDVNIVANSPFFTYNADNGKGVSLNNIYLLVQGQQVNVANGTFPGYTTDGLKPTGGAGVTSYSIYPMNATAPAFATTGLTFNTTTGAISGTPTVNSQNFNIYSFWDYAIVGRKADGSFTTYKIRVKIYRTTAEWAS
ncbi:MAG TPA: putative Ig domain-containing protein [Chitinophagaceae bacterium]